MNKRVSSRAIIFDHDEVYLYSVLVKRKEGLIYGVCNIK